MREIRVLTLMFFVYYTPAFNGWCAADENIVDEIESSLVTAIETARSSVAAIGRIRKDLPNDQGLSPIGLGVCVGDAGEIVTHYDLLGEISKYDYFVWTPEADPALSDRRTRLKAEVLAADPWSNLAVIKVDTDKLRPIELAGSTSVKKGSLVVTLGGPIALAKSGQVSAGWGIISNLNLPAPIPFDYDAEAESRPTQHHYGTLIQVDARINFETHGGALINRQGQLIGLLTSYAASPQLSHPAGFAIPVSEVFTHAVESMKKGQRPEYGLFGVQPRDLSPDKIEAGAIGIQVVDVIANTPAEIAGIRFGDLILKIDGKEITSAAMLTRLVSGKPAGTTLQIMILRPKAGGQTEMVTIPVTLSKKFVAYTKPGFPKYDFPATNGIRIDSATAIKNLPEKSRMIDTDGCVAVIDVQAESPAWKAGLRQGLFVSHVNGQRVQSARDFISTMNAQAGEIRLRLTDSNRTEVTFDPTRN
jgi:serine protease Do